MNDITERRRAPLRDRESALRNIVERYCRLPDAVVKDASEAAGDRLIALSSGAWAMCADATEALGWAPPGVLRDAYVKGQFDPLECPIGDDAPDEVASWLNPGEEAPPS